jgi:alpha-D-ribose 1-methylphosphonate 5-triphosphate synthase subunit PhnG
MEYTMHHAAPKTPRQAWMAVLARASREELAALAATVAWPAFEVLKAPETGSVMVEARAGGSGGRFNLGEATVTRCVVRLTGGATENVTGYAYALGGDKAQARLAAVLDALLQTEPEDGAAYLGVASLAAAQAARRDLASRKAAATKVEFFTLVRSE